MEESKTTKTPTPRSPITPKRTPASPRSIYTAPIRSFMYRVIVWVMRIVLRTFFRAIYVVGGEKFPTKGPAIIVANHSNQFIDAMMLFVHCQSRPISFLIAEKSMHRPIIGHVARWTHAVPVVRRKDIAKKGTGKILHVIEPNSPNLNKQLQGADTLFTKELSPGDQIEVSVGPEPTDTQILTVKSVESDSIVEVSHVEDSLDSLLAGGAKFKILPRVDHSEMFAHVIETLESGGCIGIFPEGTSTDHTQMLELQAGVATMAISAAKRGIPVKIQAIGLNYFHAHKWRSRAVLRFSDILDVGSLDLSADQKSVTADLLRKVRETMQSVTFQAPTFEISRAVHTVRSLYIDNSAKVSVAESMEISRRFAIAYEYLREKPDVAPLIERVETYVDRLSSLGLKDSEVNKTATIGRIGVLFRIVCCFVALIFTLLLTFLTLFWTLPVITISNIKSRQEMIKAKQAAPTTKDKGLDVVASKKVVVGLAVVPLLLVAFTALSIGLTLGLGANLIACVLVPIGVFFGLPLTLPFGLKASDYALKCLQSIKRLATALRNRSVVDELKTEREGLVTAIRGAVATYFQEIAASQDIGPRLLRFDEDKAIQRWSMSIGETLAPIEP